MKNMNKKGFTIVELVIVIAVIAILAGVLIPTFSGVVQKANASAALQTAKSTLSNALSMSSTAELAKDTKIVVGGYAFNYNNGNQLDACDYPGTGSASPLTLGNGNGKYNTIFISADSLEVKADGTLVSDEEYEETTGTEMKVRNDVDKILNVKEVGGKKNDLGCLAAALTADKIVYIDGHYYVGVVETTVDDKPATYLYETSDNKFVTSYTFDAEIYVNIDLDKDVVVFTNFGK